ncbi:hypothetical protein CBA19CS91_15665 [Paraburkholderia hospita]|nr:hypothetical protein CBA19CS91_15665 [Paraburkholderia hospita]
MSDPGQALDTATSLRRRKTINNDARARLLAIHAGIVVMAKTGLFTACELRTVYSHGCRAGKGKVYTLFTGKVSKAALATLDPGFIADEMSRLHREHPDRLQAEITALIERQMANGDYDADAFADRVMALERVNITTRGENYAAMRAGGDYQQAQIELVDWSDISADSQQTLWRKMLAGHVANAAEFAPAMNSARRS